MADNLSSDSNPLTAAAQEKAISCPCPRLAENFLTILRGNAF